MRRAVSYQSSNAKRASSSSSVLIILDSNVSLLLVFGLTGPDYIQKNKRLSAFDDKDFTILTNIIDCHSGIVFTPNVVSETSNLVRYASEPFRTEASETLARVVKASAEVYIESRVAVEAPDYRRIGLTDSVLWLLSKSNGRLLTTDLGLYLAASKAGLPVINFNHVRDHRPDFQ